MSKNFTSSLLLACVTLALASRDVAAQAFNPAAPLPPLPSSAAGMPLPSSAAGMLASPAGITAASPVGVGMPGGPQQAVGGRSGVLQLFSAMGHKHAECKAKLRASPVGKLLGELRKPLSTMTGGLVASEPHPNRAELSAAGPQGSAAQIKQDQLEAPQRLAAIEALGEVDCHWYPEAQAELLAALRSDRSECVRFEAAKILSRTECCTPATIQALRVCVAGTSVDGNPAERSLRIRNQAACALERCLAMCGGSNPGDELQLRPEYPSSRVDREPIITASAVDNNSGLHLVDGLARSTAGSSNNSAGNSADSFASKLAGEPILPPPGNVSAVAPTSVARASYTVSTAAMTPARATPVELELTEARAILEQFRSAQTAADPSTTTLSSPQSTPTPMPAASLLDVWRRAQ